MRLRAFARDAACLARSGRLRPAVRRAGHVLSEGELLVVVKRLDEIAPPTADAGLVVDDLDASALPALARFNARRCASRVTARFAADLAAGRRAFVGRAAGDIAGYYWWVDAGTGHPHLDRLGVALGPDDAYGYDFFVAEEHRGGGRAGQFLHGVETALAGRGYRTLWGYVRADNRPARWLYGLRGYEVTVSVHVRPFRLL
ncbi:MAG TPA: GNAT family N-acetyltransferase [Solirubrobacteraceae bacterium]|nr:GNAT family N-acetyltransferase [Solirubrobacteraceae bacterium]